MLLHNNAANTSSNRAREFILDLEFFGGFLDFGRNIRSPAIVADLLVVIFEAHVDDLVGV